MTPGPEAAAMTTHAIDPMRPEFYRVQRVRKDTHDTWTMELEAPEQQAAPFAPGQFNMLYAFGVGEVPISISGDPAQAA
jgi:NAD(P)H-flavin reductase